MFSVSDILSLLDKIPIWKTLKELPDRVTKLEEEVVILKAKPNGARCSECAQYTIFLDPQVIGGSL